MKAGNARVMAYAVIGLLIVGTPCSQSLRHKKQSKEKKEAQKTEVGAFPPAFVAEIAAAMAAEHAKRAEAAAALAGDAVRTPDDIAAAARAVQHHRTQQQFQLQVSSRDLYDCADGGKMAAALGRFGATAPAWFNEALPNIIFTGAHKAGPSSAFSVLAGDVRKRLPESACRAREKSSPPLPNLFPTDCISFISNFGACRVQSLHHRPPDPLRASLLLLTRGC